MTDLEDPEQRRAHAADLMGDFEWPPFFEPEQIRFLEHRVREAAVDEQQRMQFVSILRGAREQVLDLEILYRDLPNLFTNDHDSIQNFRKTMERALRRGVDVSGRRWLEESRLRAVPDTAQYAEPPCDPNFLLRPDRISLVLRGVLQIAGGNTGLYDLYANVVAGLWQQSGSLEFLYQQAIGGRGPDERDRLGETLRLMARDTGFGKEDIVEGELGWQPGDPPPDFCRQVFDTCRFVPFGGASSLASLPVSTYQTGITSVSPHLVCPPDRVTISGSGFGPAQPANVNVVIGSVVAQVVSWSPTAIVVTVAPGTYEGCVAFRDESIEAQRQGMFNAYVEAQDRLTDVLQCLGKYVAWKALPYQPLPLVCLASTRVHVGPPIVDKFVANGSTTLTVEPGTVITLTWQVRAATSLRLRRTSNAGPPMNMALDVTNPPGTFRSLGAFSGTQPAQAVYELIATNQCGSTTATVTVRLRKVPALRILGVEFTQAIQRFDLMNPTQNNTVRLVAGKRTLARVYVDSGITDNFDSGAGPNNQPNVSGSVTIPVIGGQNYNSVLLNAPPRITARPSSTIDRMNLDHTLNFELPSNRLSGSLRFDVKVSVENETGPGWSDSVSATVVFGPRRTQTLVRIRVRDDDPARMLAAPTETEFDDVVRMGRRMYPISESGLVMAWPPGFEEISTNDVHGGCDLTRSSEWSRMLDHIYWIAGQFSAGTDAIWTAVVPSNSDYAVMGKARPATDFRGLVSRIDNWSFAHELGHTFGLLHAGPSVADPDPRLPLFISEVGTDVPGRMLFGSSATIEIMFELASAPVWVSIASWDVVFDYLA